MQKQTKKDFFKEAQPPLGSLASSPGAKQSRKVFFVGFGVSLLFLGIIFGIIFSLNHSLKTASEKMPNPGTPKPTAEILTESPSAGENFRLADKGEKGLEVALETKTPFKLTLPKKLSDPISIALSAEKTIEILQIGGENFQILPSGKNFETAENAKLLKLIQKTKNLAAYQTSDGQQTIFYATPQNPQADKETPAEKSQWLFKSWTLYDAPPTAPSNEITRTVAYELKNASAVLDANGNAQIFFDDGKSNANRDSDFTIPKPYFLDKDGNKTDLVWKFDEKTKVLSLSFVAKKESYPIALDPSILKTDTVLATFSGKTISMNATCGASLTCGSSCQYAGITYGTVLVGTQCWMTKNLNIGTMLASAATLPTNNGIIEKWCYNNDQALCTAEGGFYHWDEAMGYAAVEGSQGICPAGWHIPTDGQQYILENYLKDAGQTCSASRSGVWDCSTAGTKLKTGGSSGLNFPLAGYRNITLSVFSNRSSYASVWSSSSSGGSAWYRYLNSSNATVFRYLYAKEYGFSVRCLKN